MKRTTSALLASLMLTALAGGLAAAAETPAAFAAPFTSHAVLQRDCPLPAWAKADIDGETVAVAIPEGMEPTLVCFAWDDFPVCNLVNGTALPAGPCELEVR